MPFNIHLGVAVVEGLGHAGVVRAGAGAHLYVASMASGSPFVWEMLAWRYRCESSQPERARTRLRVSYGILATEPRCACDASDCRTLGCAKHKPGTRLDR